MNNGNRHPVGSNPGGRPISQQQQQQPVPVQPLPINQQKPGYPPNQGPVSGSGQPVGGENRNILKEVDLQMVEGNYCQDALRKHVGDPQFLLDQKSFLCAGGEMGKGLCKVGYLVKISYGDEYG